MFGWGKKDSRPDVQLVYARSRILGIRIVHAMAWPPPDMLVGMMETWDASEREALLQQYKQAADAIRGSLETSGVWKHTTLDERQFFTAGLTGRSQQQLVDSSWAVESLSCCLWAMSLLPEMPGFDQESDPAIAKLLPPSAETLALRSGDELEKARSVAELWHWRSRTRQLIESGQSIPALPDGMTLDEVVRLTSEAAAKAGDLRDVCDGDFCAFGKPYRSISAEEYSHATSIAAERHKALNWICGMAPKNDWSLTPTDT